MSVKRERKKGKSGFWRAVRITAIIFAVLAACFLVFFAVSVFRLDAWHEFDSEKILGVDQTLVIYDGDGAEAIRLHATEDRELISLSELPYHVKYAFISAEDARFYEHIGVDFIRIAGAAWEDIKAGSYVQGASTISQQLIKLSHLTADKTMTRKLEEAVLAYQMEKAYSKDEILNMYLNYVYFGGGYYGIEAAARGYFGVKAKELTPAQAAMLAGILKSPSQYAPHLNLEASVERRNNILNLMCEYGHIDEAQRDAAKAETPVIVHGGAEKKRGYYIDTAIAQATEILDVTTQELLTGGYRIYTAMDTELMQKCEALFADDTLFPEGDCQGAMVVREVKTGSVTALVGGRGSEGAMAFNRATDIRRQPGSIIKPIIAYACALESYGYTAASMILDEKTTFADYSPSNYGNKYYGWVTLREAVMRSLNVPAVKVLSDIGVDSGKEFAEKLGITFDRNDTSLTLALGGLTYGVSPWQVATAYSCFASGGVYSSSTVIRRITDAEGRTLYHYTPENTRVMSEENAYVLTSMLQSAISEGTGRRLGELGLDLAGKTGTVGEDAGNRDAWMAAYNSEYSAAVWLGYDTSAGGEALPADATGGKYPALILSGLYSWLYPDAELAPDFAAPENVVECKLDVYTLRNANKAVLANAMTPKDSVVTEIFKSGTQPIEVTDYWTVPLPVRELTVQVEGVGTPPVIRYSPRQSHIVYRLYRVDATGASKVVNEARGSAGSVEYADTTAKTGESYSYYVVPAHPELEVNGRQVTGPKSIERSVYLPNPVIIDESTDDGADAPADGRSGGADEDINGGIIIEQAG